jgi:hypothetical protein
VAAPRPAEPAPRYAYAHDGTIAVIDLATASLTKTFKAGTGIETLTYY